MSASLNRRRIFAAIVSTAGWLASPVVVCFTWPFRVGADDLWMAYVLWQMDPSRVRGKGCALFYLVGGSSKIAMVGTGLMAMALFLTVAIGERFPPPLPAFFGVLSAFFFAAMVGYGLLALTSILAFAYGRWHRLRIWIDEFPEPDLVLEGLWPPISDSKKNGAQSIVALPILLAMFPAILLLDISIVAAYIVGMLAGVVALLLVLPVVANHPRECYPELPDREGR